MVEAEAKIKASIAQGLQPRTDLYGSYGSGFSETVTNGVPTVLVASLNQTSTGWTVDVVARNEHAAASRLKGRATINTDSGTQQTVELESMLPYSRPGEPAPLQGAWDGSEHPTSIAFLNVGYDSTAIASTASSNWEVDPQFSVPVANGQVQLTGAIFNKSGLPGDPIVVVALTDLDRNAVRLVRPNIQADEFMQPNGSVAVPSGSAAAYWSSYLPAQNLPDGLELDPAELQVWARSLN